jgi:hypothetical protein
MTGENSLVAESVDRRLAIGNEKIDAISPICGMI